MEDEGEEIVVTAPRLRDSGGGGGGGDWGGGDWGWASFYSTSGGFGADAFDFGGGGPAPAPEEPPAEVDPPVEEEIVVTAPPAEPTPEAVEQTFVLENWVRDNIVGDYRVQLDGDSVTVDYYDFETGEHVTMFSGSTGAGWAEDRFDLNSYVPQPGYQGTGDQPPPLGGDLHIA